MKYVFNVGHLHTVEFIRGFFLVIILLSCSDSHAQVLEKVTLQKVRVGVFVSPPFVMVDDNGWYSGMSIDLWNMVEDQLGFATEYTEYKSLESLLNAVRRSEIDMAVTNLTVTYERAQHMKFSFPWYDAGLRIMVKSDNKSTLWNEMKRNGQLHSYLWIFTILIVLTFLTTLLFRRKDPDFPKKWRDGLSLSFYNLMVAINTGSIENKLFGWFGHILAAVWMIFGIGVVAYVTSTITSSMTKVSLTSDINTLSDLSGKIVGVEVGGVEEKFLGSIGIQTLPYDNILQAAEALSKDEVHAVVGDAPVLEYWVHTNKERKIKVVGSLFHPDKYAFASAKSHSELMDSISVALIKLYDIGKVKELKDEYLGVLYE